MAQKLLASTLLAACLATTSLASSNAIAKDPELSFYPKNKWVVGEVGSTSDGGLRNCVISNKLNNGYIVQLAGTANGFTNINIDFRQDSFKENQKYEVKYTIPGVIEKNIPTKAYKKNLLVGDLRDNKEFADTLSTSGALDINIANTEFRIYLTGLEATMNKYETCINPNAKIAAQETPQQPKEVKGAFAPPPPLLTQMPEGAPSLGANNSPRPIASLTPRYSETLAEEMKSNNSVLPLLKPATQQDDTADKLKSIEPSSNNYDGNTQKMRKKISALEKQMGVLMNKNKELDTELRMTLEDAEGERLSISSDNWDLERATMKFNEAERQIMRIGRKLQNQKALCQKEKEGLENVLFDPELTNQQQISKLTALETELDTQKADFYRKQRQYEERIRLLEKRLGNQ